MSAITDHYSAMTREFIIPEIADNYFDQHPVLDAMWKARRGGITGRLVDWSFYMDGNKSAQTYAPFAQFLVKPVDFAKQASLPWCHLVMPVMISEVERTMNANGMGGTQVLDDVRESIEHAKRGFNERLSEDIHGDGSAFVHPYWATKTENPVVGLGKILSQNRSYGGFDSTTYTKLNPYNVTISSADFGDITTPGHQYYLPDLIEEVIAETNFSNGKINFISGPTIMVSALKRCANNKETRVIVDGDAKLGSSKVYYEGVEIVTDRDVPAGEMHLLNTRGIQIYTLKGMDMAFRDFDESPATRDSIQAAFKLSLQLISKEPRLLGKITGGPSDRSVAG